MKITKQQLAEIEKFAEECMKNNDPWHNIDHVKQTVVAAEYLAKKEKANVEQCIIATWLHDISKYKESKTNNINHGTDAAKVAKPFLLKLGFDLKDVDDICYAIHMHNKTEVGKTKESKIVWDADKIRTLGPYGIICGVCNFNYLGLSQEEAMLKTLDEYNTYVFTYFRTKTARKLEKKYMKLMKEFHKQYQNIRDMNFK
jgi:HD superfamily phosphodiesterase